MKEENVKELKALEVNNLYNGVLRFAFYFINQEFRYSVKVHGTNRLCVSFRVLDEGVTS